MPRLKSSEKRLLITFGLLFFGLGNFILFNFGKKKMKAVETRKNSAIMQKDSLEPYLNDRVMWEKRRMWLDVEQPKFTTEEDMAPKLQGSIDEMALLTGVEVNVKPLEYGVEAYHQQIGVSGEVKGSAEQVLRFASLLQDKGRFREVNSFTIKAQKNDPNMLVLQFTLTELYSLEFAEPESIETEQPAEATAATAPGPETETPPLPAG